MTRHVIDYLTEETSNRQAAEQPSGDWRCMK
jgi:hypothetical protein